MQLIYEGKIDYISLQASKTKHKSYGPTQCKNPSAILKMFDIKITQFLGVNVDLVLFENISNCTEKSDHAFTNDTLFLIIIQCKRVKHFLLYAFL